MKLSDQKARNIGASLPDENVTPLPSNARANEQFEPIFAAFQDNHLREVLHPQASKEFIKTSEEFIDTLIDAFIDSPELCKLYFGELREDDAIRQVVQGRRSGRKAFDEKIYNSQVAEEIERLFQNDKKLFDLLVHTEKQGIDQQIVSFKNNKKLDKQEIHKLITQETETERLQLKNIEKTLKALDDSPRNKEAKVGLETKKNKLNAQIASIKANILENIQENGKTASKLETAKANLHAYELIMNGADTSSSLYNKIRQGYIDMKGFEYKAKQKVEKTFYSEQSTSFQKKFQLRLEEMLRITKLPSKKSITDPDRPLGVTHSMHETRDMIVDRLTRSHLFSIVLELIQIRYLEEIVQKVYPEKRVRVYKAPLIDDLRANTDCLLKVVDPKLPRIEAYYAIDLKTTTSKEFISEQQTTLIPHYLHGTSYLLDLPSTKCTAIILDIDPTISFLLLEQIIDLLITDKPLPKKLSSIIYPRKYTELHNALSANKNKEIQQREAHTVETSLQKKIQAIPGGNAAPLKHHI